MPRNNLVFYLNGKKVSVEAFSPDETLLDYLRLKERKTGTKEGCNEGDCGACTIAMGRIRGGKLTYEPVNSCIQLLGQVDGADIITVNDLADGDELHPVQQAMVDTHGSQCGFCTPGFVMSLFAFYHSDEPVTRKAVNEYLAGNLCRCTGYRPIADAALKSRKVKPKDALSARLQDTQKLLSKFQEDEDLFVGNKDRFFAAPASVSSLAKLAKQHPDATILAGATDIGLWVTKKLHKLEKVIYVGRAVGFAEIKENQKEIVLGAGATYRDAFETLAKIDPDLREVLVRLGSRHVRASGTIGGNIANGSPIGDMPPMLIALGAEIELMFGAKTRRIKLEDFFIEYGKQGRRQGELVSRIIIPKLGKYSKFRAWKISKRFDQDISALLFAATFEMSGSTIKSARIAFGGMAGIPKRASNVEATLAGVSVADEAQLQKAMTALEQDFTPLSDMRASNDYRMLTAQNLLRKAFYEIGMGASDDTRIIKRVEAAE